MIPEQKVLGAENAGSIRLKWHTLVATNQSESAFMSEDPQYRVLKTRTTTVLRLKQQILMATGQNKAAAFISRHR